MRASRLHLSLVTGSALAFVGATALWPKVMVFVVLAILSLITAALFIFAFQNETTADR